jgi:hypothetical protein
MGLLPRADASSPTNLCRFLSQALPSPEEETAGQPGTEGGSLPTALMRASFSLGEKATGVTHVRIVEPEKVRP